MINMLVGKKGKTVQPLEVMGYEEAPRSPNEPVTQQQKEISQKEAALRFRLLQAVGNLTGGKKKK